MEWLHIGIKFDLDMVALILLSTLGACWLIQLFYYWIFLAKPYYYMQKMRKGKIEFSHAKPRVSLIICAKNETENLQAFLPSILEQNYPEYEVIIVNDDSTDDSEDALRRMENQYSHLYYTYIPQGTKNVSRKKLGIALGIKAAKYDTLLFTEADTYPVSDNWLSAMVRHFSHRETIVQGFSALEKRTGFMNKFAAYDYYFCNIQMMAMVLSRIPYGANGRNLAYHRVHFDSQKGYSKYRFLQGGEDDLFVKEVATKENMAVEMSPDSVVYIRREGLTEWTDFKISRAITRHFYSRGSLFFWRFESISRLLFVLAFLACLFYDFCNVILCGAAILTFAVRFYTQWFVINRTADPLKLEKYYFTLLFYDLMQPFVNLYFYIYRIFRGKKNYTWKLESR
ncbi:MAG: glycosyltransferase [Dysgonamonadaceae bacterium]|nr:glycosyltransferase [Dysgonamonadaceae bacterium]